MMSQVIRRGRWVVALATLGAALVSARVARAHDTGEPHKHHEGAEEAEEHGERGKMEDHEEHSIHVFADMVLGFGKGPLAIQQPPTSGTVLPGYTVDNAKVTSEAFILGIAGQVTHHMALGVRLPFTFGGFFPVGASDRGTTALGNIELEAEYERHLSHHAAFMAVLGLSLPTADGDEIPDKATLESQQNLRVNQTAMDRFALNRAAALSRGSEENALYEPRRFGINPKIGFDFKAGGLIVSPYIKMENLIGTSSTLEHSYIGEFVPGLKVSYRTHHFEPAIRAWANILFAGAPNDPITGQEEKTFTFAVEPQLIFHFGGVRPVLGLILPLVGTPALGNDTPAIGVRFAVGASF